MRFKHRNAPLHLVEAEIGDAYWTATVCFQFPIRLLSDFKEIRVILNEIDFR